MPTNLPPGFISASNAYDEAISTKEKMKAIVNILSIIPKHKGTEKLRMVWKRKLARLRDLDERAATTGKRFSISVRKDGAAQVAVIGLPNAGKSALLNLLTNANAEVADYPFTTAVPAVAMMPCGKARVQLVEVPAVMEDWRDTENGRSYLGLVRNADMIVAVIDAVHDPVECLKIIVEELTAGGIITDRPAPPVKVEVGSTGGIEILGEKYLDGDPAEIRQAFQARNIHCATVRIVGKATVLDVERVMDKRIQYQKLVVVATRGDLSGSAEGFEALKKAFPHLTIIPASPTKGEGMEPVRDGVWDNLGLIRVYTKSPGKKRVEKPITLPVDSTVRDVAIRIHKDMVKRFTFARIWGSARFPGQKVGLDHSVGDGDTVEVHIKK